MERRDMLRILLIALFLTGCAEAQKIAEVTEDVVKEICPELCERTLELGCDSEIYTKMDPCGKACGLTFSADEIKCGLTAKSCQELLDCLHLESRTKESAIPRLIR